MSRKFRRSFQLISALAVGLCGLAYAQNDAASRRAAIEGMYPIMLGALEAKNFGRARNICDQAIIWEPQNPAHHYNLACIEAQAGRISHAWGALELAVALGFNDAEHLKNDPDLLPLHSDPKFADLVRKVTFDVSAGAAISSLKIPEPDTKTASVETSSSPPEPSGIAGFRDDVPVGIYYMTRYTPATLALEKSIWYFADDGSVYANLEQGFSTADIRVHAGLRGRLKRMGRSLEIDWTEGQRVQSDLERDGPGFTWDMRVFAPVSPFENADEVAGVYDSTDSIWPNLGVVGHRLELRPDGTFGWEGVAISSGSAKSPALKPATGTSTTGRWELLGFSLQLSTSDGLTIRKFVFPSDDEKTVIKPDRMFFAGMMFKRRP